jgi:hypothetical protein
MAVLGCNEPADPPPPPNAPATSAAPTPSQIRKDAKLVVIAKLEDLAEHPGSFTFRCVGATPGSSTVPCKLDGPLIRAHLARYDQIGRLVAFLFDEKGFRIESWFRQPGDLKLRVEIDVGGLVDGIPYNRATEHLLRAYEAHRERYSVAAPDGMDGNDVLCRERAMVLADAMRPRIHGALIAADRRLAELPVTISCLEKGRTPDPDKRGAILTSTVSMAFPTHELAVAMRGSILAHPEIGAEVRLATLSELGGSDE